MQQSPDVLGSAIVIFVIVGKGLLDHFKGQKKDESRATQLGQQLDTRFSRLDKSINSRFDCVDARLGVVENGLTEVRSFVVGPDGENGLRGDVREVKSRVISLEERERDRLEREVGRLDRRAL